MQNTSSGNNMPSDGLRGLKENFGSDSVSGFIVFLLALPLSLGIAKASEFPPIMGLVTAIIGGIVVSIFAGSRLTIKGPAAGLIVIVAGAVQEFGGGELGWHLALGAVAVAAVIQILFGLLKFGKLVDFFPLSAIHGMLAAIGLIIIAKQFPVLLDINPSETKGLGPFALIGKIPWFISHLDPKATLIGLLSLSIMLGWPYLPKGFLKRIPAPLVVLGIAIPAELIMDFQHTEPKYALVHIGNLADNIKWNVSFDGISQSGVFLKYVLMFALVGSLESLLTVKAIDLLDPWKRKSNADKDLIAVGAGNLLSAFLGGLPMISEVARSSANVASGGRSRWANFFHGFFILTFVLLASSFIELIPNTALAAMLISVGIRLAHPKEFMHTFAIGKEQLLIFVTTIFFTLFEDLLVGIGMGLIVKIMVHLYRGVPLSTLFKSQASISFQGNTYLVELSESAVFTNFLGLKNKLGSIPPGFDIIIDFSALKVIDHSVLENLHHFKYDYERQGGTVSYRDLDLLKPVSSHEFAARVR